MHKYTRVDEIRKEKSIDYFLIRKHKRRECTTVTLTCRHYYYLAKKNLKGKWEKSDKRKIQ